MDILKSYPLDAAFFTVDKKPMYWQDTKPLPDLFGEKIIYNRCKGLFVLVDKFGKVFAPVTSAYQIVTNEDAYKWALEFAKDIFHTQEEVQMTFIGLNMPESRGFCEIDLARNTEQNQPLINEGWCAFIRVINSYNKTKPLSYIVGFTNLKQHYRILMPEMAVKATELHMGSKESIKSSLKNQITRKFAEINNIEMTFYDKIMALKNLPVAKEDMLPLCCKFLSIKKIDQEHLKKSIDYFLGLKCYLECLIKQCIENYGTNAYALLNIMSAYASGWDDFVYPMMQMHMSSQQMAVGKWVDDILNATKDKEHFSMYEYLGKEAYDASSWLRTM